MKHVKTLGTSGFDQLESATYEDFYEKNQNTVSKNLDEDHYLTKFRLDEKKIPDALLKKIHYNILKEKEQSK